MCPRFSFVIALTSYREVSSFLADVVLNCGNENRFETTHTALRSWLIESLLFFFEIAVTNKEENNCLGK